MRRIFTIVLCTVTCLALVAGCSAGSTGSATASASAVTAGTTAPDAVPSAAPTVNVGKYDEPVTVNIALRAHPANIYPEGDSPSNNVWTKGWKDDLNIIENTLWEANDDKPTGSDYEVKMTIAIASRNLPDIMYLSNYAQFDTLQKAGLLADLTQSFEDYASPDLKKNIMEDGGTAMSWATIQGKLMGLPVSPVNYNTARMLWIRHDWFVDTGLPVPKTLEDVLAIAKAMKAKDPSNRFGIPLTGTVFGDSFCDMTGIANSMGAFPSIWIDDGTGKAVYGTVQPKMKEVVQLYADMYKEGVIDPAFASLDGNKVAEQLTGSKIGVIFGGFWLSDWPLNTLWDSTNGAADWDVYPLLPSEKLGGEIKVQQSTPKGNPVVVSAKFAHPEALVKILNYTVAKMFTPGTADVKHFVQDPDNPDYAYAMYNPFYILWGPPKVNIDSYKNITAAVDKNDESLLVQPQDKLYYPVCKKYVEEKKSGQKIDGMDWAMAKYWYGADNCTFGVLDKYFQSNSYTVNKLVGYLTPTMMTQWSTMQQFEMTNIVQFITGAKPMSDWDKFVSDWNSMGGELIGYEVNNWLQEKNAAK